MGFIAQTEDFRQRDDDDNAVRGNNGQEKKLAVVVMLRGGPMMYCPWAAEVAGNIYRQLDDRGYFTSPPAAPPKVIAGALTSCCSP